MYLNTLYDELGVVQVSCDRLRGGGVGSQIFTFDHRGVPEIRTEHVH